MDIHFRIIALTSILFLSACAGQSGSGSNSGPVRYVNGEQQTGDYYVDSGVQKARVKLAEAAVSTSNSLGQLAAMEKASAPKSKLHQPLDSDAIGLGGLASVDWTGPVEPLVARLALAGHYKFRAVGKNPSLPVLVSVHATNMPIGDILRDANLQAGKKADIIVYPAKRLIELRYR